MVGFILCVTAAKVSPKLLPVILRLLDGVTDIDMLIGQSISVVHY